MEIRSKRLSSCIKGVQANSKLDKSIYKLMVLLAYNEMHSTINTNTDSVYWSLLLCNEILMFGSSVEGYKSTLTTNLWVHSPTESAHTPYLRVWSLRTWEYVQRNGGEGGKTLCNQTANREYGRKNGEPSDISGQLTITTIVRSAVARWA